MTSARVLPAPRTLATQLFRQEAVLKMLSAGNGRYSDVLRSFSELRLAGVAVGSSRAATAKGGLRKTSVSQRVCSKRGRAS